MGKVYENQSNLRIELTCGIGITGSTVKKIKYKEPMGDTGEWDAEVSDESTGVIHYDFTEAHFAGKSGIWAMWAYITFSDGRSAPGEPVKIRVYKEGKHE